MKKEKKKNSFLEKILEKYNWSIFIVIAPTLIIIILHTGNWINKNYPHININPIGIGNTEWLSFWGGYLGCIFAFYTFTETFKQNQRHIFFNAEIERINQEMILISEVISSINPLIVDDVLKRIDNIDIIDGIYNSSEIKQLLSDLTNTQNKMLSNDIRLNLETSILDNGCVCCKNIENCDFSKIVIEFQEKYRDIYIKVYQTLIDYNEYVEAIYNKTKNDKKKYDVTRDLQSLRENIKFISENRQHEVDELDEWYKLYFDSLDIKDIDSIIKKLKEDSRKCNQIRFKGMSDIITLSKIYEEELKKRAELRLKGMQVLGFVRDDEKYENFKSEFEKKQKEELELYCPNIYKKDVYDKSENNKNSSK